MGDAGAVGVVGALGVTRRGHERRGDYGGGQGSMRDGTGSDGRDKDVKLGLGPPSIYKRDL